MTLTTSARDIAQSTINEVSIGITNYCNAGCPQCHRTNPEGLGTVDWLPLESWTLEQFKERFSEFGSLRKIQFCGTWGDPVMAKDLELMVQHVMDNSNSDVEIVTNGSLRSEEWWWNLGKIGGHRLTVVFCVDGVTQEMHERYRRKTNLKKVLENMRVLSETRAIAKTYTVVFKHNEDYLDTIKSQNIAYGATECQFIHSNRDFMPDDKFEYRDEYGKKYVLERSHIEL